MKIITEDQIEAFISRLKKRASISVLEDDIQKTVRKIVADVQRQGDRAVRKYTEKFDSLKLNSLVVSKKEIESAAKKVDNNFLKALKLSADRIRAFHERQKEKSWKFTNDGITLGQIIRPLERVGVYVEIALCVPTPDGKVNPYVASAVKLLGVEEVYRIGGAQAVAALAYGTDTIGRVDKIAGPGNIYVAVAKKIVFGEVGIDMIAGPSEILIIGDKTADPDFIASDMLSQAEHDEMASSVLVTDSKVLADEVKAALAGQMKKLIRKDIAKKSLSKYGAIILTKNLKGAVDIANQIAPEHLEVMTKAPGRLVPDIKNAGAIFLGKWTPEPLGDYSAGPNHTLPTGGTARFSSPLGVYDFTKRTSLLNFSRSGFMDIADTVETFADVEGLEAHGNTVRVRREKGGRT
jgi:histidinol dehydrogenase